jgi:hypothetical protein
VSGCLVIIIAGTAAVHHKTLLITIVNFITNAVNMYMLSKENAKCFKSDGCRNVAQNSYP